MKRVYLDNAATTPMAEEVLEAMLPYMREHFGNPSSIHTHGRETRAAIERARKQIAALLNTSPSEIVFTSGGTEADNFALCGSIAAKGIRHVLTSPLEHHAVLHTLEHLAKQGRIELSLVPVDAQGQLDEDYLGQWLAQHPGSLVSLMHVNNEIGNLYDLHRIGSLCREYGALFHSDTVQSVGHFAHDLQALPIDFVVGAAHKFHGPKGVGFLYINAETKIPPFIQGGAQERNMRGGTENLYGIVGMAKALELAHTQMADEAAHLRQLKSHMIARLKAQFEDIRFNGLSGDLERSTHTVLNVSLPASDIGDMLLFNLDIHKISASGGSACSSGSEIGSHVLRAIQAEPSRPSVRFSFSRYTTLEEVDYTIDRLAEILSTAALS